MTKSTFPFRLNPIKTVALVVLLAASAVTQGVLAAEYTVPDLGPLSRGESYAAGVNESGQFVGEFDPGSTSSFQGFLYRGGTRTDLGTLGGGTSAAYGINAAGQVVGESATPGHATHAFLYSSGTMTDLGTLGGTHSFALAINAAGQVVGGSDILGNVARHAFLYSGGTMTDLGTLGGTGTFSAARGINDAGQVVGVSTSPGHAWHAFLYSGGTMTDLGTLGGTHSVAYGINASGLVVGQAQIPGDGAYHAFLYSDGTMTDLGTLGGTHSVAYGINAAGLVVGQAQIPGDGAYHAFLYSGGIMIDLNDLVPADVTVTNATGINAAGQIVADGRIGGSAHARALLLTPIVLDRFAYALVDVSTTGSDTPDSRYAYNAAGGAIRITQPGVGLYDVAFDSLPAWGPGLSSAVAVTAYGSSPITCSVVGYDSASPSRTVAHVGCFDVAAQRMADSPFTILVVGNQSLPVNSAFVMSGGPAPVPRPDPAGSWTSLPDRWPDVDHNGPLGDYNVRLGTGNTQRSAKLVTGTTGVGTHCNHARFITGGLRVQCYDGTGTATDQGFSVVQVAGGRPGRRLGLAWAHRGGATSYTPLESSAFNSAGGAITATRSQVGHYAMHFVGLQKVQGHTEHVQVISYGLLPGLLSTCNVVRWDNAADGLTVFVECRDGGGQFADSAYTVLVIE